MKFAKGDILFSYGDTLLQDLIEDITHGASHCAIVVENNKIIEAQNSREVGYNDLSIYLSDCRIYRLPNSQENIDTGIQWLLQQFGRPYSYWSIIILFFRCVFKLKLPWKERWAIICSRLVRDYLFQSKLNILDILMTPKEVEDWIVANGGELIFDSVNKSSL